MKKRKHLSLYEEVLELEQMLPVERQKLTDMDEAAARAHDAQAAKINTMEQRLYKGRDRLTQDAIQELNLGERGIRAVYEWLGKPLPKQEETLCNEPSQSGGAKA